jgi:hypothetical protein
MMRREGADGAWDVPEPVLIRFDPKEVTDIKRVAASLSQKTGYPLYNCIVGWFGEAALAKHIQVRKFINYLLDGKLHPINSDGGVDIVVEGIKVQVKTHQNGGRCLVKRAKNGNLMTSVFVADVFFFCEIENDSAVSLLGFIDKSELLQFSTTTNIGRDSFLLVDTKYLLPTCRLITRIDNMRSTKEQHYVSY